MREVYPFPLVSILLFSRKHWVWMRHTLWDHRSGTHPLHIPMHWRITAQVILNPSICTDMVRFLCIKVLLRLPYRLFCWMRLLRLVRGVQARELQNFFTFFHASTLRHSKCKNINHSHCKRFNWKSMLFEFDYDARTQVRYLTWHVWWVFCPLRITPWRQRTVRFDSIPTCNSLEKWMWLYP